MKIKSKIYILLILSIIGNYAYGQNLYSLKYFLNSPNQKVDIGKIKTSFADTISRNIAINKILTNLQSQGFAEASIDSFRNEKLSRSVFIALGQRYKWGKLRINNSDWKLLQNIRYSSLEFDKQNFNYKQLLDLQEDIIVSLENSGYPFASINLDSIKIKDYKIDALLQISKGRFIKIDTIELFGFRDISLGFIQQYLNIKIGEEYNEKRIAEINKLMRRLDFLNLEKGVVVVFGENGAEIRLYLREKRSNQFNGIMGFQPDAATGKLLITGNLNLNLINSFKHGERIALQWESPGNQSQHLNLKLKYPFIFNSAFGVATDFKLDKQDTSYINIEFKPALHFALGGQDYLSTYGYFLESNSLIKNQQSAANFRIADMHSRAFGLEIMVNRLDYSPNPRKGFLVNLGSDIGYKYFQKLIKQNTNGEPNEFEEVKQLQIRSKAYFQYFIPLFKRQAFLIANKTAFQKSPQPLINELYKIGGFKTLRGFDEQSLMATFYTIGTAEYRFLLDQNSFLGAFYDIAQIVNPYANTRSGMYQAFGLSFNFSTKVGVFGLSYALGKYEEDNIQFRNAKIHFGYYALF